jgi:hypothetical protein
VNWYRIAQSRDSARFLFSRPRYPWYMEHAGWWHPSLPPLEFERHEDGAVNFHISQLLKSAQHFGLSKDDILKGIVDSGRASSLEGAEDVYVDATVGNEHIHLPVVERMAIDKGWVKTSGGWGTFIKIEGNMSSLRAAMRSILESINHDNPPKIEIVAHDGRSQVLRRTEDMETFARP